MPRSAYESVHLVDTSRLTFPERLEYQKLGIMADELPTIFLNNRMEKTEYSSVLGLFLDKAARRPKEELDAAVAKRLSEHPEREPTFPQLHLFGADRRPVVNIDEDFSLTTAYGYTLKRVIAKYLSCRLGAPVYSIPLILQHPHYPYLLAKLDFVAVFPDPETGELSQMVNIQCHTATYWKLNELQNKMPVEHELRCRQEMAVANLDESIVVYLCDNNEGGVVTYRVSRDYRLESSIIQCAKAFWSDNVEAEILPIPTAPSNAAERDIALYAMSRQQYHRPPEMLERGMPELVQKYEKVKAVLDRRKQRLENAKESLSAIELQLSAYMIGREEASCGDVKMRWKKTTTRSTDLDGLALAYPDIYARFVREKIHPGFEVKLKKSAQKDVKKEAA